MELRFVGPELAELDRAGAEVLVGVLFSDERPPRGVAGSFDWRSAGGLSRLMTQGFATGALGEVLMIPGKPRLAFDKVIFFGGGESKRFDEAVYVGLVERILASMAGLGTRSVVAQLPGRHLGAIGAERAVDLLLDGAGSSTDHEVWTLVEPAASQRVIAEHLLETRRRRV